MHSRHPDGQPITPNALHTFRFFETNASLSLSSWVPATSNASQQRRHSIKGLDYTNAPLASIAQSNALNIQRLTHHQKVIEIASPVIQSPT